MLPQRLLRIINTIISSSFLAVVLLSCGGGGGSGSGTPPEGGSYTPPDPFPGSTITPVWKKIGATSGGSLTAEDGATLTIPPGALKEDTYISINGPGKDVNGHYTRYVLEPDGLTFNAPVTITIPYGPQDSPPEDEFAGQVFIISELNPGIDMESELSYWRPLPQTGHDVANNIVTVEIVHFTELISYFKRIEDLANIVVDIPWKYLEPADILFTLTACDEIPMALPTQEIPNWAPGHVGLLANEDPIHPGRWKAFEASPPSVRRTDATRFKTVFKHLYLGARRPPSFTSSPITRQQRLQIINYADGKKGESYTPLGSNLGMLFGWNCLELVEESLDEANHGVFNQVHELFATPRSMYEATEPVTSIDVELNKEIDIPVYGAVAFWPRIWEEENEQMLFDMNQLHFGGYLREKEAGDPLGPLYTLSAYEADLETLPRLWEGATFDLEDDGDWHFKWTPSYQDVLDNPSRKVMFKMTAYPRISARYNPQLVDAPIADRLVRPVTVTQELELKVQCLAMSLEIRPASRGTVGYWHEKYIPGMPTDAIIDEAVLVDLATGETPSAVPFPNHTWSITHEGWASGQFSNLYGLTIHMSDSGDVEQPPTTEPLTWAYVVTYHLPEEEE